MRNNLILKEEILRISEIMGLNSNLINEQWWKSLGKTILGATDLSDFLSHATGKLGRTISKLDDITSPSEWFNALKKTPGKFKALKDALLDSISNELTKKGITHTPATWVKKTDEQILKDLQKIGVTGDDAINYMKMFQSKHKVKAKISTKTTSIKPKPKTTNVITDVANATEDAITDLSNVWAAKTEQEISEQLAMKLPQANKEEIAKGVKLIRKYQSTNFDNMTQEQFNKYFDETVNDLSSVVKTRLKNDAGKIGWRTRWNSLSPTTKKVAGVTGLLLFMGLGGTALVLKFGKWGAKQAAKDIEKETGVDLPGVDPNKKDDKQQQPIKRGKFD